mgnify:CR=1 FL=1
MAAQQLKIYNEEVTNMQLIGNGWDNILNEEYQKDYFKKIVLYINKAYKERPIYPPKSYILRALSLTDYDDVKVVILGQDPYHGTGEANGLAFAVNPGVKLPPSLKNIYKELKDENIDILINNAGFGDCGHFEETSLDKDIQMIHTNIIAYHILTKLYLKEMIKKDSGKILNVASIAGFMPGPLMTTYYSTKNYVVRFSESIREELRRKKSKVQISILCPGPVDTNFNKVADVEFALKGLSSEYVAKYAINKFFKGKFYIVPGWKIKLARIGAKLAPASFVAKISYNMQKRKIR